MERCGGAESGAGPGEEVDAGGHGGDAGEDAAIDAEFVVEREHGGDGDEEGDGTRTIEVDEEGEQGRSGDDAGGLATDGAEEPPDEGLEHAGIGHDTEKEDGEDEHADDAGDALDTGDHEFSCAQAEAGEESGDDGDGDERDDWRDPLAEDRGHQSENGEDAKGGEKHAEDFRRKPSREL